MPSRRTPSYRLHKPSGQAVVTLNGRDFYLGKHNTKTSRAEFDRLIGEWLTNGRQLPNDTGIGNKSIAELLVAYFHFAKSYYARQNQAKVRCVK